jgi:hypothetical protein
VGFGAFAHFKDRTRRSRWGRLLMTVWRTRIETIAPWAAGLFLAMPALVAYYPPMGDLPYHEGAIGILRHFHDLSRFPKGLYRLNLGEPNQLFHMFSWAVSYATSTRVAVKLAVSGAVLAIPPCAARLARHLGASPLAALLVAPIAVGWLFYWGLVANLIGLAALLATLPVLDTFARAPTWRGALKACGAVILLYFAHEAMMFLFAAAALGLAALHRWSPKATALRLVPFVFAGAVTLAQAKWQMRFMSPAVRAIPLTWSSSWLKLTFIPHMLCPASDEYALDAMSGLCAATIAGLFWLRTRERRREGVEVAAGTSRIERARSMLFAFRWEVFAAACLVAYFVFPRTLNGATFVYHRWFAPGFAILVLAAAPRDLFVREARVARLAIAAFPIATLLLAWPSFADSDRSYRALEPLIQQVPLGSSVAGVDLGPMDPSRNYSLGPASGRILAERGGRLVYAFTDSAVSPVVMANRYGWNESLVRVGFDSYSFRPAQDMYRYQYLLARAAEPPLALLAIRAMTREAELVGSNEEWLLFKSRVPTVPLTARDFWLTGPPPETIRERIDALRAGLSCDGPQSKVEASTPGTAANP